jgi:hypothetical protein
MFRKIAALLKGPQPAGPTETIRSFTNADPPIDAGAARRIDDAWRIEARSPMTVRLYEIAEPGAEQCMLAYRARMKGENVAKPAYLEMWCRLPGRGEFFSRGLAHTVSGTTGWASYETPFYLKAGQRPDLIKLNLVMGGPGVVDIRDIELLKTPLGA